MWESKKREECEERCWLLACYLEAESFQKIRKAVCGVWTTAAAAALCDLYRCFIPLPLLPRHFPPTNPPKAPTTQPPSPSHNHQTHATTLLHIHTYLKLLLSHSLQPILPTPTQAHSTWQPPTTPKL